MSESLPRARAFAWGPYLLIAVLALLMGGAGAWLLRFDQLRADLGLVTEIRITARPGIDLTKIEEVMDTPDLFLEIRTDPGSVRTAVFKDTKVGNGLTFKLPVPLRIEDIREIKVYDDDLTGKTLKDRVDGNARQMDGEKFHLALHGPIPKAAPGTGPVAWGLIGVGGAALLLAIAQFVRQQVI